MSTEHPTLNDMKKSSGWPMCHFTVMTFHECDSDPSGRSDGWQCDHCGHEVSMKEHMEKIGKSL